MTRTITHNALRQIVGEQVDARWPGWAQRHPNLARVIDRTRFVDATAHRLRDDADFQAALRAADLDEAQLLRAAAVLRRAERVVADLLRV